MADHQADALADLLAKEAIRELAMLYSRGVDRKDSALLRDLYTGDATDTHGDTYDGDAAGYVDFLEQAFNHLHLYFPLSSFSLRRLRHQWWPRTTRRRPRTST